MHAVKLNQDEVKLMRDAIINVAQQESRSLTEEEATLVKRLDVTFHNLASGPRFTRPALPRR